MTQPTQEPKTVLVTGVTGQDGSYMADYLLTHTPHTVYGMVRRTAKPDYSNLTEAMKSPRFTMVVGDLSDSASIENVVKLVKPDYFINLGAQSFVKSSWDIPLQTGDVDTMGVVRCLEAIRKYVPHCRLYNAGSSEEFGETINAPQDETHPPRPQSPYGAAKCAARHYMRVYRKSYNLYAVQGYLFNHESERRGSEFVTRKITLGVARIARAIQEGQALEPIQLGNLDAKRDWSHAEDFVDGIWRMLNQEQYLIQREDGNYQGALEGPDETVRRMEAALTPIKTMPNEYVLASGETHTVREFVEKAFAAADIRGVWWDSGRKGDPRDEVYLLSHDGKLATKMAVPLVKINPEFFRPAEVDLLLGDASRARDELGWRPKVSFDELVRRMVQNDLANYRPEEAKRAA